MTMTTHDDQVDNQSAPTYRDNSMDDNKCDNRMATDARYAEADASDDNREAMMLSHTHNEEATAHLNTYSNAAGVDGQGDG